eukprot:COSAG01_NODE_8404_length_2795_cov_46.853116_4_plen_180_part_00
MNMGMQYVTLPILLEADSHPGRWGLVVGAAWAFALASGTCLGRLPHAADRPLLLLLRAVMMSSSASFLLGAGNKLQSVELLVCGALLHQVRWHVQGLAPPSGPPCSLHDSAALLGGQWDAVHLELHGHSEGAVGRLVSGQQRVKRVWLLSGYRSGFRPSFRWAARTSGYGVCLPGACSA